MFDIGFFELLLIGVVSLVVLGPERLPGAIRTVTLWVGRLRRSFNTIKQDIEREIGADEIRRQLRNEEIMEKFRATQSQVKNTINAVQKETAEIKKSLDVEAQVGSFLNSSGQTDKPATDSAAGTQEQASPSQSSQSTPADTPAPKTAPASDKPQGDG